MKNTRYSSWLAAELTAGRKTRKKYRQWGISEEKRILEELPKVENG